MSATSAEIHAKLDHPVVDCDGHMIEHMPVFLDFLKQVAGPDIVKRYTESMRNSRESMWYTLTEEQLKDYRLQRPPFWAFPSKNTEDRATAMLPKLLRSRLDEFGFDFSIVYPTYGFFLLDELDDELRQAGCRAQNTMVADIFGEVKDRLTPAASIPTNTPEEGIAELEYAVNELGLKAAMIASLNFRQIEAGPPGVSDSGERAYWVDNLALDAAYDYDPFWQACMDLGVAPTAHSRVQGHGWRRSTSSYMYNQIGHFAEAGAAFGRALFFGGVTNRFPDLNFAILEGGVGWAMTLFATLVEVYHKRGGEGLKRLDPNTLDRDMMAKLFDEYGGERLAGTYGNEEHLGYASTSFNAVIDKADSRLFDEFTAAGITRAEDIVDRFVDRIWFGCEADDIMIPHALRPSGVPFDARLKATFGSDYGHWDVSDMAGILAESYEMVEDGRADETGFRDFTFANPVSLHAGMNPNFFKGTVVEEDVDTFLAEEANKKPAVAAE